MKNDSFYAIFANVSDLCQIGDKIMKINGIDFGNVLGAAGVQNFSGDGYWFHRPYKLLPGLDLSGMTFVSKTVTAGGRAGNMPMNDSCQPKEWFPKAVKIRFWKKLMLNALGLPSYGINWHLNTMDWQKRREPFMISIAVTRGTRQGRIELYYRCD